MCMVLNPIDLITAQALLGNFDRQELNYSAQTSLKFQLMMRLIWAATTGTKMINLFYEG